MPEKTEAAAPAGQTEQQPTQTRTVTVEDVERLERALAAEREAHGGVRKTLKSYQDLGDPEALGKLRQEATDRETAEAERKGQWDKLRGDLVKQHQDEKTKWDEERKGLITDLEAEFIDSRVERALGELGGNPKVMSGIVKSHLTVGKNETTGKREVRVLKTPGDSSSVRYKSDGSLFTVADLVTEMRDDADYSVNFAGSGRAGSGSPSGSRPPRPGGGGLTDEQIAGMSMADYKAARARGDIR